MNQKSATSSHLKELLSEAAMRSPTGHFCHFTSVYYHKLTNQVPTWVYIRKPKSGRRSSNRPDQLTNLQIRKEFLKPHRQTVSTLQVEHGNIVLVSGNAIDQTGVIQVSKSAHSFPNSSKITNLERCLIDVVVAPQYNGGIYSIPEIFQNAAGKLDIHKLIAQYRELNFLYPYFQTLGFFFQHTDQSKAAEILAATYPPQNHFFVDKNAKTNWLFDSDWNVYYPPGLI